VERSQGDSARLGDAIDREMQRDDLEDAHADVPTDVCLVCGEALVQPTLFDCGHAVCVSCTTGMLHAKHKDAIFALACPCSFEGCAGQFSFLACAAFDGAEAIASSPALTAEVLTTENVMLRAASMFPCPSPACAKNGTLLFMPSGKSQTSQDTECDSCGMHICVPCTRRAGTCIVFHAPVPCAQRVALENHVSTLRAGKERAEAVEREDRRRRILRHHEQINSMRRRRRQGGADLSMNRRQMEAHPEIDAHVLELVGKGARPVSYGEIFDAASTAVRAAEEREKKAKEAKEACAEQAVAQASSLSEASPECHPPTGEGTESSVCAYLKIVESAQLDSEKMATLSALLRAESDRGVLECFAATGGWDGTGEAAHFAGPPVWSKLAVALRAVTPVAGLCDVCGPVGAWSSERCTPRAARCGTLSLAVYHSLSVCLSVFRQQNGEQSRRESRWGRICAHAHDPSRNRRHRHPRFCGIWRYVWRR